MLGQTRLDYSLENPMYNVEQLLPSAPDSWLHHP